MPARKKSARKASRKTVTKKAPRKRPNTSKGAASAASPRIEIVSSATRKAREVDTVKFGMVTIRGQKADPSVRSHNVKLGTGAFTRAVRSIAKPGVAIELGADVPAFRAAPDDPSVLIRRLHGKEQRGRIRQGKFEELE